jgi:hypothetical protein
MMKHAGVRRLMAPTPTASDHIERASTSSEAVNPLTGKSVTLDRFVKFWPDAETQASGVPRMWQTPVADDSVNRRAGKFNSRGEPKLSAEVRMWPTATATAAKGSSPASLTRKDGRSRENDRLDHAVMAAEGGSLNPAWVESLMGFPAGWTDLDGETEAGKPEPRA